MRTLEFVAWMKNTFDLEPVEIHRCINAIGEVSFKSSKYGLPSIDLLEKGNIRTIDTILSNSNFKRADTRANKMYSSALDILKDFFNQSNDNFDVNFEDNLIEDTLQYEKKVRTSIPIRSKRTLVDTKQIKPSYRNVNNKKIWNRNPNIASEAIANNGYCCEVNKEHQHFTSKFNGQNYVEAHHLVPMKFQERFDYSLDVYANIVSLCLICHKKLHFSNFAEKKEVLQKLFLEREDRLLRSGISIQISDLYNYYEDK